jgi:hypothetical protein
LAFGRRTIVDLPTVTGRPGGEPASRRPPMADFWPGQTGARHAAAEPPPRGPEPARSPLPRAGLLAVALAVVVVVGAVLAVVLVRSHADPDTASAPVPIPATTSPVPTGPVLVEPAPTTKPTASPSASTRNVATSAPPKLPAAASFEVAASDRSVTVRSRNLGTALYRVTLAGGGSAVTPKVAVSGTSLRLTLVKDPETAAPPVTILLNNRVRWALKLSAGNTETAADLTGSKLASLELAGGAHAFDLSLPPATGTLPVRITHGMNQLKIKTNGRPVRLTLRAGAGTVILAGDVDDDPRPGTVLTSDGWADATDRVDVDSVEGVGTLTVNTDN